MNTNIHRVISVNIDAVQQLDTNGGKCFYREITVKSDSGSFTLSLFSNDRKAILENAYTKEVF